MILLRFKVVPDLSAYVQKVTIFEYGKKQQLKTHLFLTKITGSYRAF